MPFLGRLSQHGVNWSKAVSLTIQMAGGIITYLAAKIAVNPIALLLFLRMLIKDTSTAFAS